MTANWKAFQLDSEANSEANSLSEEVPDQGAMLSDLSDRGLILVHGEDAETFLQNQLSNDIRRATENTHQTSAWCNPKGRIIANFRIFKRGDKYYLSLSKDLVELVLKKLRMYVMMSKVTLEDASDSIAHFGLSGENASELLAEALGDKNTALPGEPDQVITQQSLSILRVPGTVPRFEIFSNADEESKGIDDAITLWSKLKTLALPVHSNAWLYLDILAGQPLITQASSEAWIPQMVNFIAIEGVDFKKGCYPGQEVVARLNYLGKTKRRMYHILIDTQNLPAINDALSSNDDKEAGKILNAVINPDRKVEALAVLKIGEADKALSLASDSNASVTILELPYSVNDD